MLRPDETRTDVKGYEQDLHLRIRAEFAEMPGLTLTLPQAARLFNLERTQCERVLGALVAMRVLSVNGTTFARIGSA